MRKTRPWTAIRFIRSAAAANAAAALLFLATAAPSLAGPTIDARPATLSYAPIQVGGASPTQGVNVSNVGSGASLSMGTATLSGADPTAFVIAVDTCSQEALPPVPAPGSDCWINVAFAPTTPGDKSAVLNIPSDDPLSLNTQIALDGHAMIASLDLSPAAAIFEALAVGSTSAPQTFIAANDGEAVVTISSPPTLGGSNPGDFGIASSACTTGLALSPGETCAFAVSFSPTSAGARAALLRVPSSAFGPADTATLNGVGIGKSKTKPGKKCRRHDRHSKSKHSKRKHRKCHKKRGDRDRD